MAILFQRLSKVFNALIPNTVNKSPRLLYFERGKIGLLKTARPLDEAIGAHDMAKVEELLAKGADPNLVTHFTGPALNEAVKTGDIAFVKTIIEHGGDINGVNLANSCALHQAISDLRGLAGHKDILEYLLSKNPRLDIKNSCDMTPLEWARQLGDDAGEKILAKAARVNLLDELKPHLQQDGAYLFDATVEMLSRNVKIEIPKFRKFYFYASIEDGKVDVAPVGKAIAEKAAAVFGLENAKVGYYKNGENRYAVAIMPEDVWQAKEQKQAEAQQFFDDFVSKGCPTGQEVQKMKPLTFKKPDSSVP